jgi:DNA repair protein RadA/Sms
MAKGKTSIFFCQSCGYESSKWMGQCPGCKEWNTFVEEVVDKECGHTGKAESNSVRGKGTATVPDRDDL